MTTTAERSPVDELADLTEARRTIRARLTALPGPGTPAEVQRQYAGHLADQIAGGEQLPDDLAEQYATLRLANEDRAALRGLLMSVVDHLDGLIADAARRRAPHQLAELDTELGELVDAARPLAARLGDVRTAEQAIDAGVADVWKQLHDLGGKYAVLRNRQQSLTVDAMGDGHRASTLIRRHGILANLPEVWPDVVRWDANERGERAPWPHESGLPFQTPHGRDFLLWMARTPAARPWVPSVEQLHQAEQAATAALNAHYEQQITKGGKR